MQWLILLIFRSWPSNSALRAAPDLVLAVDLVAHLAVLVDLVDPAVLAVLVDLADLAVLVAPEDLVVVREKLWSMPTSGGPRVVPSCLPI
jgi:hypothetical protein